MSYAYYMGESSQFPKSWTFEIQILKLARMAIKMDNLKLKWLIVFESEN